MNQFFTVFLNLYSKLCFLFVFLQSYNFTKLKAFTPYKLGIMAFNSIGDGPVETISNQWTEEGGNTQNHILGLDRIDRLAVERKRCRFLGN